MKIDKTEYNIFLSRTITYVSAFKFKMCSPCWSIDMQNSKSALADEKQLDECNITINLRENSSNFTTFNIICHRWSLL